MVFTQHQLLKVVDGATVYIAVVDCWLVTFNATCVAGAAAEDAGRSCLPWAVGTLVASLVTSTAPEVMQSLLHELNGPGWESSREDQLSWACWFSHGVRPVGANHRFVRVMYWLRSALFSGTW